MTKIKDIAKGKGEKAEQAREMVEEMTNKVFELQEELEELETDQHSKYFKDTYKGRQRMIEILTQLNKLDESNKSYKVSVYLQPNEHIVIAKDKDDAEFKVIQAYYEDYNDVIKVKVELN